MDIYKKRTVGGKTLHFYGFDLSQGISLCSPEIYPAVFKAISTPQVSSGIAFEPLSGEYLLRAKRKEKVGLPGNELQENSAILMFTRTESIDAVISRLQECKRELIAKQRAADAEMWSRKLRNRIISFSDAVAFAEQHRKYALNRWG